MLKYQNTAEAC